jgi:hypothetical protein
VNIQGGQPVVRFDGVDDYYSMTTSLAGVYKNKTYGICIVVAKDRNPTGDDASHVVFDATIPASANVRSSLRTRNSSSNQFVNFARRLNTEAASTVVFSPNDSNFNILAGEQDWANNINRLRLNFTSKATSTYANGGGSTSNDDSANVDIGSKSTSISSASAPVDLGQIVILNTDTTESLVKRLHHAAAFSFKISCN